MKIFSICVVKNEIDIIEEMLKKALEWSDKIFIYDGLSTDGTWEKVLEMQGEKIIPWKQDNKVFAEFLRKEVFDAFKLGANEGDWWCQLNADEIYIDNPRGFLTKVPSRYQVVWGLPIEYYITDKDIENINFSGRFLQDSGKLKYYKCYNAERRFFKHRKGLIWSEKVAWPIHLGMVFPELIKFKHYPYRSPQQIQMRLDVRKDNRNRGFEGWEHASQNSWHDKIEKANNCFIDSGNNDWQIDYSDFPNYKDSLFKKIIKYIMHHLLKIWP